MSKKKIFLTLTGYQLTWLACVFGENKFDLPSLGIFVGIIYLLLYFYFNSNKIKFLKISFIISILGYVFDSLMVYFSIYEFNTSEIFGTIPAWMLILWFSFSTLFDEILKFFERHKLIGIVLSSILGPLTYYLGEPIGIITIYNLFLFFFISVMFWFMLMLFYLEVILKKFNY